MDDKSYQDLLDAARAALSHSYSPYSKFPVGAAILTTDGNVVTATNVENASYGLTMCAERSAVFRSIAEGHKGIRAIAVASTAGEACFPCGACRQVISEFATPDMEVIVEGATRQEFQKFRIGDLLPHVFGPGDLAKKKLD